MSERTDQALELLREADPKVGELIEHEERRERDSIRLIASENYASRAVMAGDRLRLHQQIL